MGIFMRDRPSDTTIGCAGQPPLRNFKIIMKTFIELFEKIVSHRNERGSRIHDQHCG
jgi:hypothetical protein